MQPMPYQLTLKIITQTCNLWHPAGTTILDKSTNSSLELKNPRSMQVRGGQRRQERTNPLGLGLGLLSESMRKGGREARRG